VSAVKLNFASLDEARAERKRIVPEIQRLGNWLAGVATDGNGLRVSSQDYHRQRGEVVARLTQLQQRAGAIRDWLREREEPIMGQHPNKLLLARCYRLLLERDDEPEVAAVLRGIEEQVPLALLDTEAHAGHHQEPKK
jgi:hypothetical protein